MDNTADSILSACLPVGLSHAGGFALSLLMRNM